MRSPASVVHIGRTSEFPACLHHAKKRPNSFLARSDPREQFTELMSIERKLWRKELDEHGALFEKLQARVPRKLRLRRELLGLSFV